MALVQALNAVKNSPQL